MMHVEKLPISAFIITLDEADRIEAAIEALSWADEVVVVDSGSTDGTVELARLAGAKIHYRKFDGYGGQKAFAESLCMNNWVMNVDADEIVTPALAEEIVRMFQNRIVPAGAFKIRILNVYPGEDRPRLWANDYNVVRLYHRDVARFRDHPVYDRVILTGVSAKQLAAPIHHHPHRSLTHAIEKAVVFSDFRAQNSKVKSKVKLLARLTVEFPLVFLKTYIGRRHFTGGWKGFYFSVVTAFMRTTRIARMIDAATQRSEDFHRMLPSVKAAK